MVSSTEPVVSIRSEDNVSPVICNNNLRSTYYKNDEFQFPEPANHNVRCAGHHHHHHHRSGVRPCNLSAGLARGALAQVMMRPQIDLLLMLSGKHVEHDGMHNS